MTPPQIEDVISIYGHNLFKMFEKNWLIFNRLIYLLIETGPFLILNILAFQVMECLGSGGHLILNFYMLWSCYIWLQAKLSTKFQEVLSGEVKNVMTITYNQVIKVIILEC